MNDIDKNIIEFTSLKSPKQNVFEVVWRANYTDRSFLDQKETLPDGNIKDNRYEDIDRDRLVRFDLISVETKKPVYAVYLQDGEQLIFRRRTLKKITGAPDTVVFLVGYQQTFMTNSGPKNKVVLNYLHPDGSIALDGARSNLELLDIEM